jgi:hypothetical protein
MQEQDAGATVHPDTAGRVEGGEPMEKTAAHSPSYSGGGIRGGGARPGWRWASGCRQHAPSGPKAAEQRQLPVWGPCTAAGRAAAGGHSDSAEAAEDEREEEELGRDVNRTDFQPWDE